MALEVYARNNASATVSSGGTTAPATGTVETWTVSSSALFPAASSTATPPTVFHVADPASQSEIVAVTNVSGTTWTVTRGAENTTPVTHAAGFTVRQVFSAGAMAQASRTDWLNAVTMFGADPTGVADSATAIGSALSGAAAGQVVYLPVGTYLLGSGLTIPTGVELAGSHGSKHTAAGSTLKMSATFSGTSVLTLAAGAEQRITRVNLDASAATAGTAIGIDGVTNIAKYVQLADVLLSGAGMSTGISQGGSSNGWRSRNVVVSGANATGILANGPDSHWVSCQALNNGTHGWSISGAQNSHYISCRGDWNGDYGFLIQGAWTTGSGSGGIQLVGCSTDRNVTYGVLINATGNSPIVFTNLCTRRDGSAGTGSALRLSSATVPVIVSGWQCFPGVNDDGTGTASPATGLDWNGTNTYVAISDALIHAITTPWPGAQTNLRWRNVSTRTGSTSAPGTIALVTDSA